MLKKKTLFYFLILLSSYIFAEGTLNDVVNSFQDYCIFYYQQEEMIGMDNIK